MCLYLYMNAVLSLSLSLSLSYRLKEDCKRMLNRLVGLVVQRFESRFRLGDFSGSPCQAPGVMGSPLGPVGPVSVYCEWLR